MLKNDRLTSALKAVAEEDAALGASAAVRERLIAEVRSGLRPIRRRRAVVIYAVAAVVVLAVAGSAWRVAHRPPVGDAPVHLDVQVNPPLDDAFFPLGYSNVPVTGARIVRLDVSRAALSSFGVPAADTVTGSSAGTVLADVLVGDDGLARAVRFVKTTHQEQKP